MENACKICGNDSENSIHRAREMMFGTRDEFDYLECSDCGTLRLIDVPDLSKYYPEEYYSLDTRPTFIEEKLSRRVAAKMIGKDLVQGPNLIGQVIHRWRPHLADELPKWILDFPEPVGFDTKILDVGSGAGKHLRALRTFGFQDLTGADAFIAGDLDLNGIRIYKRSLEHMEGSYDIVMLHHSFEHLAEPADALYHILRLLKPNGTALIRIPVVSFAWENYGVNWVQLDPPRHIFLYTERSFRMVAERSGFHLLKIVYDSEAFQFHGSEQYQMDIPMNDPRAFTGASETSIFTQEQNVKWKDLAKKLNLEGRGDQACFYLRRK